MEQFDLPTALFYAFVGGVILNAMPCVFPMLGIKLMSVVKKADATKATIRLSGILYTLGVIASFLVFAGIIAVLKTTGQQVGWGFQLQSPIFVASLAILFTIMSLNFFGMFEIGIPHWLIPQKIQQKDGLAGEFIAGVMVGLVASPCTAPFMASALGFALAQPISTMMLIFAFLGLGLGAPFLLLTFIPAMADYLPKPGAWMITLRQILAFPLLLTVVWLIWVFSLQTDQNRTALLLATIIGVTFAIWVYNKVKNKSGLLASASFLLAIVPAAYSMNIAMAENKKEKPEAHATAECADTAGTKMLEKHGVTWHVFQPGLAEKLQSEGKTVFVDFTAAWCLTCQTNAKAVFSSQEVVDEVSEREDVALIYADWTDENDDITAALESFGRSGVPLYLLYKPGKDVEIMPQVLTPSIFLEAIR